MGRLRNLSQSLKAAAFQNSSGGSSPMSSARTITTEDHTSTKELPVVAQETSSLPIDDSPSTSRRVRSDSRPASQVYEPPTMGAGNSEHIQELQPVFGFLSSHQNKLYQEGYFLKLNDLDTHGKPNSDRSWTECFAQLVGTVLSLWDAAALDAAGQDGEVAPTFINLADASIKMIETLPTRNNNVQPLQNVLSVSTAGKNRYLLHFNSLHSLTQWTAGIRLSMFENASLQEVYTGSLIAGKGKHLNNIRTIMEKSKFREEDWCRVRFGAGTPWRRCWYVIEPPDEKEWQKASKSLKKKSTYDRPAYPKGDLKFYDSRKTKKATPIATISDVYSAYAVYPQSKPLIEQSTLVKLEGRITIHSTPESKTEGFVFVMPEVHPAVSGFEMMLRFLFPIYDTFTLYGRPSRLVADTLDSRGLMFAMPKDRRYGYLDIIDVAGLIHTNGSDKWSEREWRKQLKELISRRMSMSTAGRTSNAESGRRSLGSRPGGIRFGDSSSIISAETANQSTDAVFEPPKHTLTAPPSTQSLPLAKGHNRSVSESVPTSSPSKRRLQKEYVPSRLSVDREVNEDAVVSAPLPPLPPAHRTQLNEGYVAQGEVMQSNNSSDSDLHPRVNAEDVTQDLPGLQQPPTPVAPAMFQHQANDQPARKPRDRPDLRRERSRMSNATLSQLVDASKNSTGSGEAGAAAAAAWKNGRYDDQGRGVIATPDREEYEANVPLDSAMMTDSSQTLRARSTSNTSTRKPLPRTKSEHSVTRKPLPNQTRAVAPTADSSSPSEYPNSFVADRHQITEHTSMRPPEVRVEKEKKLGGVRKTVGDPNYDTERRNLDVPQFDFGATQSLQPTSRPGTAGRVSPLPSNSRTPSGGNTPQDEQTAYFSRLSPLPSHTRSTSQIWQPGSTPTGQTDPHGLSAEEFVQQRAAAARIPQGQAPRKNLSAGKIEEALVPSPKKLQKKVSSRPTSRNSGLEFSGQLSAREQEHVARVTGGPLLNLPDRSRTPDPNVGLIGAIETREQEKRGAREGISSQLAQAEILRRQQQQAQAYQTQQMQQMQSGFMQPGNGYAPSNHPWAHEAATYPNPQYQQLQQYAQPQPIQQYQQLRQYSQPQQFPQHPQQQHSRGYSQQFGDYYAPPQGYGR